MYINATVNARIEVYIRYYYDIGVADGTYLEDVPFRNLAEETRYKIIRDARHAAQTGLIPRRKYIGNTREWRWVLEER